MADFFSDIGKGIGDAGSWIGGSGSAASDWVRTLSGAKAREAEIQARADAEDFRKKLEAVTPGLADLQFTDPEQYKKFVYEAQQLGPSAFTNIKERGQLQGAQDETLAKLAQLSEGKLGTQDIANLRQIRDTVGQQERAQREAMAQEAQSRGIGGSGLDLMRQMQVQQGAAQKAAAGGWDVAEQAANRGLQALSQRGQLATTVRGQELGKAQAAAQAQDEIARFNAQAMNQQRQYNAAQEWQRAQANANAYKDRFNMAYTGSMGANQAKSEGLKWAANERAAQGGAWDTLGKVGQAAGGALAAQMAADALAKKTAPPAPGYAGGKPASAAPTTSFNQYGAQEYYG